MQGGKFPVDRFLRIPLLCGSLWPKPIKVPEKRKEQPAKGHPQTCLAIKMPLKRKEWLANGHP